MGHFHAASAYSKSLSEDNRVAAAKGCKIVYCCGHCCGGIPCFATYNCASSESVQLCCMTLIPPLIPTPIPSFRLGTKTASPIAGQMGYEALVQAGKVKQGHPADLGAWYGVD